MNQSSSINQ